MTIFSPEWVEQWEAFQRRQFPCLVNHFFHRFFDSEMASGDNDNSLSVGAIFALLAVPGLLMPLFLFDKYSTFQLWIRHRPLFDVILAAVPDRFFFVNFSTTVTGIVTVLKWDSLFPDRRDFANLASLPIPLSHILYAKVVALFALMAMFAIDLNCASVIVFPMVVTAAMPKMDGFLGMVGSHGVSVVLASVFTFLFFLALTGLLMNLMPWQWFRRVSRPVRLAAIILLLAAFFSSFAVAPELNRFSGDSMLRWLPAVWFTGLGARLMNHGGNAHLLALSGWAWQATGFAAVAAAITYLLSYRRYFLRIPESLDVPGGSKRREARLAALFGSVIRSPFDRACAQFAIWTLFRSEKHTLFLGAYLGLGLTLAGGALMDGLNARPTAIPNTAILEVPLLLTFFLLSGLRFVFDLPAELRANWMFQVAGGSGARKPDKIARWVMLSLTLGPLILLVLPWSILQYGWTMGLTHIAYVALSCLLLTDVLLLGYRKIPFTCAKLPGKRNPAVGFAGFCAGFFVFVSMGTDLDHWILEKPWRLIVIACLGTLAWQIAKRHIESPEGQFDPVVFEEERDPAVRTLSIA